MTDDDIQRGLALCEAATPGPWLLSLEQECVETTQLASNGDIYGGHIWSPDFDGDQGPAERVEYMQRDGAFIASARTLLPAALHEVQRLRGELEQARGERDRLATRRDELLDKLLGEGQR